MFLNAPFISGMSMILKFGSTAAAALIRAVGTVEPHQLVSVALAMMSTENPSMPAAIAERTSFSRSRWRHCVSAMGCRGVGRSRRNPP